MKRKKVLKRIIGIVLTIGIMSSSIGCGSKSESDTVKVGLLHSLTGSMAISEVSVRDAELLAIEEINAAGGVLGKQIE